MSRPIQILFIVVLTVGFGAAFPSPAQSDDMLLFKNGHTLRADELEIKDGVYRITTMAGGVMEIPVQLVERVISCVVDKDVEEQRGSDPAGSTTPRGNTMGGRAGATKIPPAGLGGAAGRMGKSSIGGRAGGGAISIPPRGGRSLGKPDEKKTSPEKGKEEK